jgi:hypothetical protein
MPLSRSAPESVAAACPDDSIVLFAWSPDGQSFTYLSESSDLSDPNHVFVWHLVVGGTDRVIGNAPVWCHCGAGEEANSITVAFSPNGQFVSLVDFLQAGTTLQIRRLDGSFVWPELRGDRNTNVITMGVWSGGDLFFRDLNGVERWHDSGVTSFLRDVAWLHPWASPAGGQIVYAVRGGDGFSHVSVVDTATAQTRQLSNQPRAMPVFLTPRYVWYRGERACVPNEPGICTKTTFSGKTYIFDLQSGTEWESIIAAVADVWPHGS